MQSYNPKSIEAKWQKEWARNGVYLQYGRKKKFYVLDMFPYPSGAGLHVGHPKGYIATDVLARMKQLQGYGVLHPMGWDAFGLPAEQFALKNKVHPEKAVRENIATFKKQLGKIGFTYDWEREINTTDPAYYKWTQWIFLQMWKNGLAYESQDPINWCPSCKTGLANEDLEQGKCERCGSLVEKRPLRQWVLRMTKYADRLLRDLDTEKLQWSESIKEQQRNWIGRSEGAVVKFPISNFQFLNKSKIQNPKSKIDFLEVYTTRLDTIFGCTYLVVAPEHELLKNQESLPAGMEGRIKNHDEVKKYIKKVVSKSDLERTELSKEKTGIELEGIEAVHPFTGKRLPVYVADYVLGGYGTGAVMGVPAHDVRDFEFAKKYGLDIDMVVVPSIELTGTRIPQRDKKNTSKNCVTGVVFDATRKKVLVLKNKKDGARMFVGGGIDIEETPEQALIREACEETGYKVKIDSTLIASMYGRGYKPHRDVNCFDHDVVFIAHVTNKVADKISSEEQEIHEVLWENVEDVVKLGILEHHAFMWKMYLEGEQAYIDDGTLIDSKEFSGMTSAEAREKMAAWLVKEKLGKKKVNYKMRDWTFSRQRYWGEPIPLIHCGKCGVVAVPERDLPVKLPKVKSYEPTDTGESPLASITSWVNVKCPQCKGKASRETNTMPQWAGSSWYYLRFIDPKNSKVLVDKKKEKKMIPVDVYVGGTEHATRHLLYARFWHKFLYDIKVVSGKEPFKKLVNQGLIVATDGRKMSKRWNNVINPDDMVAEFGADAFRIYEMFMGPFTQSIAWNIAGVVGAKRFLEKVWKLGSRIVTNETTNNTNKNIEILLHQTIKKVGEDIENFKFNTAISALMILVNTLEKEDHLSLITYQSSLLLLSPFAPHIAEELWASLGKKKSIFLEKWPKYDPRFLKEDMVSIAVQVNGKLRAVLSMETGSDEEVVKSRALEDVKVQTHIAGKAIRKVIYIQDKILNLVV
ncbi:MAG: class I tRNA ligase family protein [bacterium]|nr:class I tRNA ligase family protein [bacterium]